MYCQATRQDALQLFIEGQQAFADMERRGIRIDVPYCKHQLHGTRKREGLLNRMGRLRKAIETKKEVRNWKKEVGEKFNLDSNAQLKRHLYRRMGLTARNPEDPGVDEADLRHLKIDWLEDLIRIRKIKKVTDRLQEILREQVGGVLHPFFNLHLVKTYRSSSDHINFQNQNVRNKWAAKIIRRAFIPRKPNHCISEKDYSGVEVKVSACNHKDKNMLAYIRDPTKDMHRDQAMECFLLDAVEVSKDIRYCGKNMFVFPQFYGDYFKNCATSLWNAVPGMNLMTVSGIPLLEHLRSKGIKRYAQFEKHIERVESRFWNVYFADYRDWKEDFYGRYLKRGWFDVLTGFRCSGPMRKNEVLNYPIQGPAFHCLLWSVIQSNRFLKKHFEDCWLIGQIHDSMIIDHPENQYQDMMYEVDQIMTKKIRKHWPWIIVPLETEVERSEVGKSWWTKKEVTDAA